MAKSKDVWASTYRTSEVKDGEIVRTVAQPGEDVTGLDSDTKKDYKERGLIVSREDFESEDEGTVEQTMQTGTTRPTDTSEDESSSGDDDGDDK